MQYTGYFKLRKPSDSSIIDILNLNENADIIDQQLKILSDHVDDNSNPHNIETKINAHTNRTDNPHKVTRQQLGLGGTIVRDETSRWTTRIRDEQTLDALHAGGPNPLVAEMIIPLPAKAKNIIVCWSYSMWDYYDEVGVEISLGGAEVAHVNRGGGDPGEGAPVYEGKENEIVITDVRSMAGTNQILKLEVYGDATQASIHWVEYDIPITIKD